MILPKDRAAAVAAALFSCFGAVAFRRATTIYMAAPTRQKYFTASITTSSSLLLIVMSSATFAIIRFWISDWVIFISSALA